MFQVLLLTSNIIRFDRLLLLFRTFNLAFLFWIFLSICSQKTMAEKAALDAIVQGNAFFTKKMYDILAREPGNVFFSPISTYAVLSLAFQGSQGKTHETLGMALGVTDHLQAAEGYEGIINHLNNITNVQLLMANKIYVKEGRILQDTFKEISEKQFKSEVESINFVDSRNSAKKINNWVEAKTANKIKDLMQPEDLNDLTRLVLINAIYFKGNWAKKFDQSDTKIEKFYLNDNDTVDVEMMNQKAKFNYKEDEKLDAKILELHYANEDVSLIIILPNQKNGIAELEQKLSNIDLTHITHEMHKREVVVKLPKFKIETTIDLKDPLEKMGLEGIFTQDANFKGMIQGDEPIFISKAIQKAFIEVNEEGSEAAAATGLQIVMMSYEFPVYFYADHPFLFSLVYKKNIILFNGLFKNNE